MNRLLGAVLVCTLALGFSSCAGTANAVLAGPLAGGSSLTARVWNTETSGAVKVLSTPIAFAVGTFLGVVPAMFEGVKYDWENNPVNAHPAEDGEATMQNVWDPFAGGLWGN